MQERFGATNPKSLMLRFHTQTAGVQLPPSSRRSTSCAWRCRVSGPCSAAPSRLHTNSFDEAIALPTEKAARLALRTQQVIAYETDVTKTVDPFAGSYVVEAMTDDLEEAALELIERVEGQGGAVAAIEEGFQKNEIERSAYRVHLEIDGDERTVVGLNRYPLDERRPTSRCAWTRRSSWTRWPGSQPCARIATTTP